jgi:hypothetical protein
MPRAVGLDLAGTEQNPRLPSVKVPASWANGSTPLGASALARRCLSGAQIGHKPDAQ